KRRQSQQCGTVCVGSPAKLQFGCRSTWARLALFHTGDKPAVELPALLESRTRAGTSASWGTENLSLLICFRYAGAKGVLVVVDPDEDPEFLEAGSG
uniref:SAC domain-containing protein n=1 Tax=Macrostomum lignano TaxID=282301 RepID=A0A1I8FCB5_9PLAT